MRKQYQAITPDSHPHIILHYEVSTGAHVLAGAQIRGGPIHFTEAEGARHHIDAIWHGALESAERVRSEKADQATANIATRREAGLKVTREQEVAIRAHYELAAEAQIAGYHADVRRIMDERGAQIGEHDADLAAALEALVHSQQKG